MMYDKLRKKAEKKVQAKIAFYICAIVFAFMTIVLLMISFYLPSVAFWLRLPIPLFIMILCILYITAFGMPYSGMLSEEWQEEEVEREILRMYRNKRVSKEDFDQFTDEEKLELKAIEKLKEKWDWDDDYV